MRGKETDFNLRLVSKQNFLPNLEIDVLVDRINVLIILTIIQTFNAVDTIIN